jgi:hypothetical protein
LTSSVENGGTISPHAGPRRSEEFHESVSFDRRGGVEGLLPNARPLPTCMYDATGSSSCVNLTEQERRRRRSGYHFDGFQRDHDSEAGMQPKDPTELVLLVTVHHDVQEHLMRVLRLHADDVDRPVGLMSA